MSSASKSLASKGQEEFDQYLGQFPCCKDYYSPQDFVPDAQLTRNRAACNLTPLFVVNVLKNDTEETKRIHEEGQKQNINPLIFAPVQTGFDSVAFGLTPLLIAVSDPKVKTSTIAFLIDHLKADVNLAVRLDDFSSPALVAARATREVTALSFAASAALAAVPFKTEEEWDQTRSRLSCLLTRGGKISRSDTPRSSNEKLRLVVLFKACLEGGEEVAKTVEETRIVPRGPAKLIGEYCCVTRDQVNTRLAQHT